MMMEHPSVIEVMKKHGAAYVQGHSWRPDRWRESSTRTDPFGTAEEADRALKSQLIKMGYSRPRWWQYWRWGETVPECWIER
ncbi:hypothetical protein IWQ55_004792 [Labrenzia sp. EL_208]|nr:hypothetical protein [Labrenzia sp. EL_132]MBG6231563.1 hypothetical protein [Labrenzia sp. EL_208]